MTKNEKEKLNDMLARQQAAISRANERINEMATCGNMEVPIKVVEYMRDGYEIAHQEVRAVLLEMVKK